MERLLSKKMIFMPGGLLLIFCVWGILLYLFLGNGRMFLGHTELVLPQNTISAPPHTIKKSAGHHFYSDRFVIAQKNKKGEPLLIDLIINRKENPEGGFTHYYLGNIIAGTTQGKFYREGISDVSSVLPDLLFSSFEKVKAEDHSVRDTYTFSAPLLGKNYEVVTDELTSDFITKNEIDYTIYTSTGNAKITVDNEISSAHVMHQGAYADDYRSKVFFDEKKGEIRSETIQLIVWDEDDNFLFLDRSKVFEFSAAYASHFWALMKDKGGYTKKSFSGELDKKTEKGITTFHALIPDFNQSNLSAKLTNTFSRASDKGWVEAAATTDLGSKHFYGLGYYHEYGLENTVYPPLK